jgi:hypothetical protein
MSKDMSKEMRKKTCWGKRKGGDKKRAWTEGRVRIAS